MILLCVIYASSRTTMVPMGLARIDYAVIFECIKKSKKKAKKKHVKSSS